MKNTNPKAQLTVGDLDGTSLVQLADGKIGAVSSEFKFDRITGIAKVVKPDGTPEGTVINQWQCLLLKDATSHVLGWAWPTVMQADLAAPDVNITNAGGVTVGRAYSAAIPNFWDVPVTDLGGNVTHYAASVLLPDATYVEVQNIAGTTTHYILTP